MTHTNSSRSVHEQPNNTQNDLVDPQSANNSWIFLANIVIVVPRMLIFYIFMMEPACFASKHVGMKSVCFLLKTCGSRLEHGFFGAHFYVW